MTQGPPCPNCGSLLTWYPDQHQWGCDRCRVMYPPQVMVQPQAYARSAEKQPRPRRVSRGPVRSKRPLVYGALAAVLVAAAVGITVFVIHGKKAQGFGWADRDTAVQQIFGSLGSGDLETLLKRSVANTKYLTCEGSAATPNDELRAELSRAVDQAKGATFAIDKVTEPDGAVRKDKGSFPTRACKLETDLETHEVHVTLKTTRNGKVTDSEAKLVLAKIDDKFYLAGAPRMGGCEGAAAWAVMVLGREADPAQAAKLNAPLLASCVDDKWPAKTVDCVANALGIKDEHSCLKDLDAAAKVKLATAVDQALDKASPLRAIAPMDEAPKPVSYGTPEKANVADFWLVPRSDGAVLVTSPMVTAVFPQKPTIEIKRSTKPNGDGKLFDIYTFSAQPTGEPLYELHVIAMGHNMHDPNGFKSVEDELAKLGKVEKVERTEEGQQVTRLSIANTYVLDGRIDLPHGLIVTASASGAQSPNVATFLSNVHLLSPADPGDNPDTLAGVRQRPGSAKPKLVVHDQGDHYTFEIPFNADIKRKVEDKTATVMIGKKGKPPAVVITELAPWDALAITPASLAASQAKLKGKAHLVWEPFQHRMFKVACSSDAPCDPIVKSFHFSDPEPPTVK
ncbi:MAG: hypothetical protein QM831_23300 [Kofleriaceae bacterium]